MTRWTGDETEWLIDNADRMGSEALATHLGRSVKSIQRKAEQLHLRIWRTEQFGDGLRDIQGKTIIGNRTLLAKTCPKCGRFLMARRYWRRQTGKRQGHWYTECRGCMNVAQNEQRPERDRGRRARERNQAASKRNAENSGRPWTQADDAVVRDVENYPSHMEVATVLARTLTAVETRADHLGVHRAKFADVGKHWVIHWRQ